MANQDEGILGVILNVSDALNESGVAVTKEETKNKAVKDMKIYIMNNWKCRVNQYAYEYIGWIEKRIDQIAGLRAF